MSNSGEKFTLGSEQDDAVVYQLKGCARCGRFNGDFQNPSCEALEKIPDEIWNGRVVHDKPFSGDGGKMFVAKSEPHG